MKKKIISNYFIFRMSGIQSIGYPIRYLTSRISGQPDISTTGYLTSRISRQPDILTADYLDSRISDQPDISTAGYVDSRIYRQPDISTAGYPAQPCIKYFAHLILFPCSVLFKFLYLWPCTISKWSVLVHKTILISQSMSHKKQKHYHGQFGNR